MLAYLAEVFAAYLSFCVSSKLYENVLRVQELSLNTARLVASYKCQTYVALVSDQVAI